MCGQISFSQISETRLRDVQRGRILKPERFGRMREFAYRRWLRSRDLRQTRRWIGIMETVDKRKPY